jgi:hypothetical protein
LDPHEHPGLPPKVSHWPFGTELSATEPARADSRNPAVHHIEIVLSIDAGNGRFVIQTGSSPVTIQTNIVGSFRRSSSTFGGRMGARFHGPPAEFPLKPN